MMKNWTSDYISVVINANLTILLADMPIDSWALGGGDKLVLKCCCRSCAIPVYKYYTTDTASFLSHGCKNDWR